MDTSGFNGWWPVKFFTGKKDGQMVGTEGFRNVMNGEECRPQKGWNGEPPYPTGDLHCRHTSRAYRDGYDRINWNQ
jgi:hypothetical protein